LIEKKVTVSTLDGIKAKVTISALYVTQHHADSLQKESTLLNEDLEICNNQNAE
jgi:ribosomal protein S3AE